MPTDLRDRLTDALLHVRGLCVGDPDTTAANVMDARRDADAAVAVLAADPGNLPKRMAEAIVSHKWTDFPRSAHNQHNYYAECAVCQRDVPRIAEVALPVRDELVAHLSARAAKAEARVEHAEAGAQLSSERLAKVQQELDRLWSPAPDSAGRHAAHCEWGATSGAYCSCVGLAEIARLRAERDALKAVWSEWRERLGGSFPRAMVQEMTSALDTETTTTPARETV